MKNLSGTAEKWIDGTTEDDTNEDDKSLTKEQLKELALKKKEILKTKRKMVKSLTEIYQMKSSKEIYDAIIKLEDFDELLN